MNYDQITVECKGDCDNCEVYLECQYQTSSGAEKEEWLKKLTERDNALQNTLTETTQEDTIADMQNNTTEEPSAVRKQFLPDTKQAVKPLAPEEAQAIFAEVFNLCAIKETSKPVCEKAAEDVPVEDVPVEDGAKEENLSSETEPATEEASVAEETPAAEVTATENVPAEDVPAEEGAKKEVFKLTPPENNEELIAAMCAKRARKLSYKPSEILLTATFKVIGTDKKNEIGEKIKDILAAEIKEGTKLGYLDKFDGLKSSELKEEYENETVYEYADQEFRKTGVIYDGKKIRVYIFDWNMKACHHVGYVDKEEATEFIPYFEDKDNFSFDVNGIITGGKAKRVEKVGDTVKIINEKGDPVSLDVDITIIKRKD